MFFIQGVYMVRFKVDMGHKGILHNQSLFYYCGLQNTNAADKL